MCLLAAAALLLVLPAAAQGRAFGLADSGDSPAFIDGTGEDPGELPGAPEGSDENTDPVELEEDDIGDLALDVAPPAAEEPRAMASWSPGPSGGVGRTIDFRHERPPRS